MVLRHNVYFMQQVRYPCIWSPAFIRKTRFLFGFTHRVNLLHAYPAGYEMLHDFYFVSIVAGLEGETQTGEEFFRRVSGPGLVLLTFSFYYSHTGNVLFAFDITYI